MSKVRHGKNQPSVTTLGEGRRCVGHTSVQAGPDGYLLSICAITGYLPLLLQRTGWHHPVDGEGVADLQFTGSWDSSGWKGPQEVSTPTSRSKRVS